MTRGRWSCSCMGISHIAFTSRSCPGDSRPRTSRPSTGAIPPSAAPSRSPRRASSRPSTASTPSRRALRSTSSRTAWEGSSPGRRSRDSVRAGWAAGSCWLRPIADPTSPDGWSRSWETGAPGSRTLERLERARAFDRHAGGGRGRRDRRRPGSARTRGEHQARRTPRARHDSLLALDPARPPRRPPTGRGVSAHGTFPHHGLIEPLIWRG